LPAGCHEPRALEAREVVVAPGSKFHEIPRRETPREARRWSSCAGSTLHLV